ncbi:MAG: tetratricopeptide repeat protein [Calothrix sp. MO_167.B42]|nr:tetratricopeptide repeat protein [Calothrix sp. MO_167.B42]
MKLSLCMIVKDEARALPKCLQSAKKLVDEIVVLDTGSTDKTPQIAREHGAKVHDFQWCNDFSAARNEALKYVTGDWVLVLDADETLVPGIMPQLKEAIQGEEYLLINLVRHEVGAIQSPYSMVSRLFRNHPNIHFSRPYHALVDDSVVEILRQEPDWVIGYLQGVAIEHQGYQQDAISQKNKTTKALAAMEDYLASNPQDPYVYSKLGALYVEMGKVTQGVELLEQGIALLQQNHSLPNSENGINEDILYELYYHLGIANNRLKIDRQAIHYYQEAVKLPIYPLLKLGAYNNLGSVLKASGDLVGAKTAYETAIKIDPNFATGHYNLGMIQKTMNLYTDAIASYQKAIQLNPKYADACQNLGVVLLKVGNVKDSVAFFKRAIFLHEKQNPQEATRLRQGLQEMGLI